MVRPVLALHEHPFLGHRSAFVLYMSSINFQWSTASSRRKITVSLYFVMIEHEQKLTLAVNVEYILSVSRIDVSEV